MGVGVAICDTVGESDFLVVVDCSEAGVGLGETCICATAVPVDGLVVCATANAVTDAPATSTAAAVNKDRCMGV